MAEIDDGLFTASAALIDELLNGLGGSSLPTYLQNLYVVCGALVRQLCKRYDTDKLANLSDTIVEEAYRNEVARVVRDWPIHGDWPRPLQFFGTAQIVRNYMAAEGMCEKPKPAAPGRFPSLFDMSRGPDITEQLPTTIRRNESELLYANPAWMRMAFNINPTIIRNAKFPLGVFCAPYERDRLREDRDRAREGLYVVDQEYRSLLPGVERVVVLSASVIYDDDGEVVGELRCIEDAARIAPETRVRLRHGELAKTGLGLKTE